MKKRLPLFFLFLGLLLVGGFGRQVYAQTDFTVTGLVTDAATGEPIPFASVALVERRSGTLTDEQGRYKLVVKQLTDSLAVSSMGFKAVRQFIDRERPTQSVDFKLTATGTALQEVVVRAGENPAWRVLRQVRKNRDLNDRRRLSAYEYDSYVKTDIGLSQVSERMRRNPLIKHVNEAMSKYDSVLDDEGHKVLPLLASESVTHTYFRSSPERRREDVSKTRIRGVAVDDAGLSSQLLGGTNLVSQNFYDNYISILGKDFASPIGDNWRSWYEFFLADTMNIGGHVCYKIEFEPKRPEDLAFIGSAWIDTTSFALCEIDTKIGSSANLNYVRSLSISQELESTIDSSSGKGVMAGWLPVSISLSAHLTGVGKQSLGLRAQVRLRNSNIVVNQPHPLGFYEQAVEQSDTVATANEAYWHNVQRTLAGPDSLDKNDQKTRQVIDKLRSVPAVKKAEAIGQILVKGYLTVGGFDLGPYPYLFAVNSIEGLRTRFGFRTNDEFSRHLILRGYLAYGTLDGEFKYGAEMDYLFSRQHWTVAGVRIGHDLERLGLTPELIGGNRAFYALSRFGRYRGGYRSDQREVFFKTEPVKGVLLTATLGSRTFDPLFPYRYRIEPELGDQSETRSDFTDAFWSIEARLARKEKYIMDGNERITLGTRRAPVLTIRYTRGLKMLGSDFDYHRITMRAQQSFRLGVLGRTTYLLSAGYTPDVLPAPLLFPHIGNPTPLLTTNTFNRMQFYEFVSDQFVAIHVQHRFEGLLFNRLPGIRKFNWRLIANVDALWGSLSKQNQMVTSMRPLPDGVRPIRFGALDPGIPYMELGYGIDNIFKLIRIQAIHRLNYLGEGPNGIPIDSFAVKASATISF